MKKSPAKSKSQPPPPTPLVPTRPRRFWLPAVLGILFLATHLVYFTWHTDRSAQAFNHAAVPTDTIEGIPEPRFFLTNDSYVWLAHARDMLNTEAWRLRYTFMDNAPYGREMHWSHALLWPLTGMAKVIMATKGWPVARAVELAGIWLMPLFLLLLLGIVYLVLLRKLGLFSAGLFLFGFLSFECTAIAFYPLKPDHHGLQMLFCLGALICLQLGGLGWVRTGAPITASPAFPELLERGTARRWFIASGICGGLALWVGATVWLITLGVIAVAMLSALPLFHPPQKGETFEPALWRYWAGSGLLVGFLFYLLEYAPNHFAMRLEVNHPLFWASWIGVAWGLEQLGDLRRPLALRPVQIARLGLAGLLAGALPLAILFGPDAWHQMNDPLLKRLHAMYITEFLPFSSVRSGNWVSFFATFRLFFIALPWALGILLFSRQASRQWKRLLWTSVLFSGLFLGISMLQQRWGYWLAGSLVWLTVLVVHFIFAPPKPPRLTLGRIFAGFWLTLILCDVFYSFAARLRTENDIASTKAIPQEWIVANLSKRAALRWGLAAGTNSWCFAGIASEAPPFYYYSEIPVVASYYWENAAGWQAEAPLQADTSPDAETARAIAQERGITHIVTLNGSVYPELYYTIATGQVNPVFAHRQTLIGRLTANIATAPPPKWLVVDEPLTAIGQSDYFFQTPAGIMKETTQFRVFSTETR